MNQGLYNKTTFTILFLLLFVIYAINISTFRNGHNWENSDFVGYVSQSASLVDGTFDELVLHDQYTIEHSNKETGAMVGPWGYPLILSPSYYLFGTSIYSMKAVTNLFFVLSLLLIFITFQDRLKPVDNFMLVSIFAFNPWFFDFKDNVLSDIPYFFFSLSTLYVINRFVILKKMWINKYYSYTVIGILIFISYNIRSVALVLLPTLMLVQLIENRSLLFRRNSEFFKLHHYVPYLVFAAFYILSMLLLPGSDSSSFYFDKLLNMGMKGLIFNIKYYAVLPSRFFPFLYLKMHGYGFEHNKFSLVIYAVMLIFILWGMARTIRKDFMYVIYMLVTIPVIMFFSSRQGFRLLIPMFPFFLYFLFRGLAGMYLSFEGLKKYKPVKVSILHLFCAGLLLVSIAYISINSYKNIRFNETGMSEGPYSIESRGLFEYIKLNTDKNDALIFYEPRSMFLFAERKAFVLHKGKFEFNQLYNSEAAYIAYNKIDDPYKLTVEKLQSNFKCVYENDTYILCSLREQP